MLRKFFEGFGDCVCLDNNKMFVACLRTTVSRFALAHIIVCLTRAKTKHNFKYFYCCLSDVRTSRAPKPNDIFILDISIEKVNDSFSITFMAAECGYDFPLIGIEGAYNVSGSVNDEVMEYRNEDWPGNVTLEVMRNQPAAPPIGGTFDLTQDGVTIPGSLPQYQK